MNDDRFGFITHGNVQYILGYSAGYWAHMVKRLNLQYLRGYVAGMLAKH